MRHLNPPSQQAIQLTRKDRGTVLPEHSRRSLVCRCVDPALEVVVTGVISGWDLEKLFDTGQQRFGVVLDVIKNHCFDILVTQTFTNCVKVAAVLTVHIHVRIAQKMRNLLLKV